MKKYKGYKILEMIDKGEIQPMQELIRLTANKDKVYLNNCYDLVFKDTDKPLLSHSISDYEFELVKLCICEKSNNKTVYFKMIRDDETHTCELGCLNKDINVLNNYCGICGRKLGDMQ